MPATAPDELIYDEAVRAIGRQQTTASELRHGASLLIATAAIAISLLDLPAVTRGTAAGCAWLALAGFVLVSISTLAVIWPARDGPSTTPSVRPLTMPATRSVPYDIPVVRHRLLMQMEFQQQLLARRNKVLSRAFRAGGFGLLVQLAATVAARILTT